MMKEERRQARKAQQEKTKEVKAYGRRVHRLQQRASKLTDDGLLVEYARRSSREKRKSDLSIAQNALEEE